MYTIVVAWRALLMSSMNSENRNKEAEETVRLVVVLWELYKPSLGWTNDNVAIAADTWVSAHGTVACARVLSLMSVLTTVIYMCICNKAAASIALAVFIELMQL